MRKVGEEKEEAEDPLVSRTNSEVGSVYCSCLFNISKTKHIRHYPILWMLSHPAPDPCYTMYFNHIFLSLLSGPRKGWMKFSKNELCWE